MQRVLAATRLATMMGDFARDPAYAGLAAAVRRLITDGRLPVGTRLPSERDLTGALGVSRTTVSRAYADLRDGGWLVSRQGSGSVARLPPGRGHRGDHLLAPAHGGDPTADTIDLTCAAPAATSGMAGAYARAAAALPAHLGGTGYFPTGTDALRAAVAATYDARGLATSPEQVVIVPGALAGVALAARVLVGPGDRVVAESPTYSNAIAALGRTGGRVLGTDVTGDPSADPSADPSTDPGADIEGWQTTLRQVLPRVAYVVADFHNPTGALRSADDRERLAATMRLTGTTPVVDEAMMPLALDGQTMPAPLAAWAPQAFTVGTLSKSHWGGLRIGWLRVPEGHVDAVLSERLASDCGTSVLEQLVAADVLGEVLADPEAALAERRAGLRASRDAAYEAVRAELPDWSLTRPGGGMCLWCRLPEPASTALTVRARAHGVLMAPGPAFAPEGGLDRFVRIPYALPEEVMREAVGRLAAAWRETLAASDPSAGHDPGRPPVMVA